MSTVPKESNSVHNGLSPKVLTVFRFDGVSFLKPCKVKRAVSKSITVSKTISQRYM